MNRRQPEPPPVTPTVASPFGIARQIPSFFLPTQDGVTYSMPLGQPTVLVYFRGQWCRYCRGELAGLQTILEDVRELGATIIGISPDTREESQELRQTLGLTFQILSDTDFKATDIVGLRHIGGRSSTGEDKPYPTTFVLDKSGIVRAKFENETYKVRPEAQKVLDAVKRMLRKKF